MEDFDWKLGTDGEPEESQLCIPGVSLGFAFALLIQKTESIWGAVLFHTASDLHWFIAFGSF